MGLLNGLMGNASEVPVADVHQEFYFLLSPEEGFEKGYKLIRDMFLFTNKRLIVIDKQGLTGSKMEVMSIPYRSITRFSVETAGTFDLDAELKIWMAGEPIPMVKKFNSSLNIYQVQAVLAAYVLR